MLRFIISLFCLWLVGCGKTNGPGPFSNLDPVLDIPSNENSPLGVNVSGFTYFRNAEYMTVDAMIRSSDWFKSNNEGFDEGEIISSDSNGWPTEVEDGTEPIKLFFSSVDGRYPTGTYVVLWEGGSGDAFFVDEDATNLRCDDGGAIGNCVERRALFDINDPTDQGFAIGFSGGMNAENYVRNMRVIMPGGVCGQSENDLDFDQYCRTSRGGNGSCDSGESCYDFEDVYWNRFDDALSLINNPKVVFHPATLEKIRPFSTVRTMEMLSTNFGNDITDWDTNLPYGYHTQGIEAFGAHPIYPIALANVIGADLWYNVPHQATDNYVTELVELVNERLSPNLRIYVEYSNETWNPSEDYPQSEYVLEQAISDGLGEDDDDDRTLRGLYNAKRAVEIFDLFNESIDDPVRLKRVLGSWIVYPSLTQSMLDYEDTAASIDMLAIGAYFAGYLGEAAVVQAVEEFKVDEFFSEMYNGGLLEDEEEPAFNGGVAEFRNYLDAQVEVLADTDIALVAYEGGTHTWNQDTETNEELRRVFRAAHRDVRMAALYNDLLTYWRNSGAQLFNIFKSVEPFDITEFGALEYQEDGVKDSPRYEGILEYIVGNPCNWDDCE